jgi:hypothetical protein
MNGNNSVKAQGGIFNNYSNMNGFFGGSSTFGSGKSKIFEPCNMLDANSLN